VRIGDIGRIKRREGIVFEATIRNRGRPFDPAVGAFLLVRARAWDTYEPRRRRWLETPERGAPLPPDGRLEAGAAPYHWTFRIAGYDARTLFVPQRPRRIQSAASALFRNRLDCFSAAEPITEYTVEAAEPVVAAADFAQLRPDLRDPALVDVPRTLARRLRAHAPKRKGPRIADAVAAIREHFAKEGFRYTLALPDTLPPEQDPIEAFLERKEGHCELYATAACFFLRQWGIPARVAGGVRCSEQRGPGVYRAYYRNAHAWVEIRCIGKGYVAVDFTPPDASAAGLAGTGPGARETGPGVAGGTGGSALDWGDPFEYGPRERERVLRWMSRSAGAKPVLVALAAGLFLALLWGVVRARSFRPRDPLRVSAPPGVPRRTLAFYARWLRECARAGHPRGSAQTPREFLAALPEKLRTKGEPITAEFERKRYG
jgi:transglutaminase-like putative cysteine protease